MGAILFSDLTLFTFKKIWSKIRLYDSFLVLFESFSHFLDHALLFAVALAVIVAAVMNVRVLAAVAVATYTVVLLYGFLVDDTTSLLWQGPV